MGLVCATARLHVGVQKGLRHARVGTEGVRPSVCRADEYSTLTLFKSFGTPWARSGLDARQFFVTPSIIGQPPKA